MKLPHPFLSLSDAPNKHTNCLRGITRARLRSALLLVALGLLSSCTSKPPPPEWLVINYWATWCGPCREEIPELNRLNALNPERLQVLGVNYDAPQEPKASQQIEQMGIEFSNISLERAKAMGLSQPTSLPTSYILHQGKKLATLQGPQTLASLLAAAGLQQADLLANN